MSVGPGQRAGAAGGRRGRLRGGPVHRQRGEAGLVGLRRRHQGPGAADGGPGAGPGGPARPPDVADALALAVCHLTTVPLPAGRWPRRTGAAARECRVIGLLRGAVVVRTGEGEVIVDVGGVGYRVAVTPATAAAAGGRRARRGVRSTCTPMCARTPSCSTASCTTTSGGASRCCWARTGSARPWPWPSWPSLSPAALSTAVLEEDLDTLCTVPGVGTQDGGPAADRAEEPPGPARPVASVRPASGRAARVRASDVRGRGAGRADRARLRPRRDPRCARRPARRCRGGRDAAPGAARAGSR